MPLGVAWLPGGRIRGRRNEIDGGGAVAEPVATRRIGRHRRRKPRCGTRRLRLRSGGWTGSRSARLRPDFGTADDSLPRLRRDPPPARTGRDPKADDRRETPRGSRRRGRGHRSGSTRRSGACVDRSRAALPGGRRLRRSRRCHGRGPRSVCGWARPPRGESPLPLVRDDQRCCCAGAPCRRRVRARRKPEQSRVRSGARRRPARCAGVAPLS